MILAKSKKDFFKNKTIGWKTKGGNIYLLCCFHNEKTPSLVIHKKTNKFFHCYGCGKNGKSNYLIKKFGLPKITVDFCDKDQYYHPNWFENINTDLETVSLETVKQSSDTNS